MFRVIDKTTGEVFTVYGLNGTHFLIYDAVHDWWFFKPMEECKPYEQPKDEEFLMFQKFSGRASG